MNPSIPPTPRFRSLRSSKQKLAYAQARRDLLDQLGLCINATPPTPRDRRGPLPRVVHGPRVEGSRRCQRCLDVRRKPRPDLQPQPQEIAA